MPEQPFQDILNDVARYYSGKINEHGVSPRGVDWNSLETQVLRFERLLEVCDFKTPPALLDYGCGYGALLDHLRARQIECSYAGFDISETMIARAREAHPDADGAVFFSEAARLAPTDYVLASGIFNVRQSTPDDQWKSYMLDTVERMARLARRGFAFNALTLYSDVEKRRADLYYSDPLFWFDQCKRNYSRMVSLLHDYPLYEFTLLVRL